MSRPKIVDGKVNLFLTLSAVFTNDETEPLLATNAVRVSEDHPLFAALTKVWHVSERTGAMWNDDPNDDSKVRAFRSALEHVLDVHFE